MAERQQSASGFIQTQRLAQADHFTAVCPEPGYKGSAYRLAPHRREFNLAPSIREAAPAYFNEKKITWHIHANHGLSSQVCCLNFLMPLATRPDALSRVIAHALRIEPPEMLEIECGPNSEPWFIGFKWIERDYLNEGGASSPRTRGANATSSDAILRFREPDRDALNRFAGNSRVGRCRMVRAISWGRISWARVFRCGRSQEPQPALCPAIASCRVVPEPP